MFHIASTHRALSWLLPCWVLTWGMGFPLSVAQSPASEPSASDIDFFETKIRPLLIEYCYDCHSAEAGTAEGQLALDSRAAARRGGERGPAVVPGDPRASLLYQAVTHADSDLKMPPRQPRLPDQALADLREWIERGAPDPRSAPAPTDAPRAWDEAKTRDHWAYQSLSYSRPPDGTSVGLAADTGVLHATWPRRQLDRFVLAELQEHALEPSPDAEPRVLLRRLHFDLAGLPPTQTDTKRFLQNIAVDGMEKALAAEVDALLASPRFGERWGRHWLDVARFGESSGKEANISFPYAWRYRDYVIDAFNADVPFDRFLVEQLAGDLLPAADAEQRARLLIATGFLALGPKNLDEANQLQFLADLIDEQIDSVTRGVLASSLACARCHDHKFDPFSMRDYYALAGVFASTETFFGTAVSPANRIGGEPLTLPESAQHAIFHDSIPAQKVKELKEQLAAMQQRQKEGMEAVRQAVAAGVDPGELFTLTEALGIFWRSGAIRGQLLKVSETGQALPLAMGVLERGQVIDVPLLQRGEIGKPGDPVPRAFPAAISPESTPAIPSDQSGRLEFAHWLTHPQHPLTSRVMVNRIWTHLFGAGLVPTTDNFGTTGESPSHPRLLDNLALQFIDSGWSVKQLVRELVLSRTYRQSSHYSTRAFHEDPDNRLLWRIPKRRLEAEAIRDAMLTVSGEIDLNRPAGSLVGRVIGDKPISLIGLDRRLPSDLDGAVYRSVYLPVIRDRLPDVLDLFDFAEPSLVTGQRETTNVPVQALYLMNSPFVQDRAAALAKRLIECSDADRFRIRHAFEWCYNRPPDAEEEQRCLEFVSKTDVSREVSDQEESELPLAWVSLSQALLSTAEFRNID